MNTLNGGITKTEAVNLYIPSDNYLYQNYPNPFNSSTVIRFRINSYSFVTLRIYDFIGKEVEILFKKNFDHGEYNKIFDGSKLNSGVYFYKLELQDNIKNKYYSETKKFLIIK